MKFPAGHAFARFVVLGMVAALIGCGSGGVSGSTVKGVVTMDGKPVTSGVIAFLVPGGRPISAVLQSDGSYECSLSAGEYQVRVDAPPPMPEGWVEGQPLPKLGPRLVPEKFASFATSGLSVSIAADSSQQHDFALP